MRQNLYVDALLYSAGLPGHALIMLYGALPFYFY